MNSLKFANAQICAEFCRIVQICAMTEGFEGSPSAQLHGPGNTPSQVALHALHFRAFLPQKKVSNKHAKSSCK